MKYLILILFPTLLFSQVGINTTQPTTTLDVNGNIRIREMETVTSAKYMIVTDSDGVFKKMLMPTAVTDDCPEFLKAESNTHYVKFKTLKSLILESDKIMINGLSFTQSGHWVENQVHYYSWTNTSGQPLNINSFSANFGNQTCNY